METREDLAKAIEMLIAGYVAKNGYDRFVFECGFLDNHEFCYDTNY